MADSVGYPSTGVGCLHVPVTDRGCRDEKLGG